MDRNLLLFVGLSFAVLVGWEYFFVAPQRERLAQEERTRPAVQTPASMRSAVTLDLDEALASPHRLPLATEKLTGSIDLQGLVVDDVTLLPFKDRLKRNEAPVRLLYPRGTEHAFFLQLGMSIDGRIDEDMLWKIEQGSRLTPQTPVVVSHDRGDLRLRVTLTIDDDFMISSAWEAHNTGDAPRSLAMYGALSQHGYPPGYQYFALLHEGVISVADGTLKDRRFKHLVEDAKPTLYSATTGWIGITNQFWLAAIVPEQSSNDGYTFSYRNAGTTLAPVFRGGLSEAPRILGPGETMTTHMRGFTGAKYVDVLQYYQNEARPEPVPSFDKAIDWGHFFFLTRPVFYILHFFNQLTGQFWLAILLLTLVIKGLLYPLASKGYESMSRMKKFQPELTRLRERHKGDQQAIQREMMALYKREKVNPVAGCLPILLQMPIFFALYKTLFVAAEMRQQPFLWIDDLSAPDPTSLFNLFGLLPYDPTAVPFIGNFLGVGILPLLMGIGMWAQTTLNPPPPDPMQRRIFALLPVFFTFIFASFAAGLVLYWVWNSILSLIQQIIIMKKNNAPIELFRKLAKKKPAP